MKIYGQVTAAIASIIVTLMKRVVEMSNVYKGTYFLPLRSVIITHNQGYLTSDYSKNKKKKHCKTRKNFISLKAHQQLAAILLV